MIIVKEYGDISFGIYKPTILNQYLIMNGSEEYPTFVHTWGHKIRNSICLLRRGFSILYMIKDQEILGFLSYGKTSMKGLPPQKYNNKYIVRFIWINPKFRGKGYARLLVNVLVSDLNIDYSYIYWTVQVNNIPSIATAKSCGFKYIGNGVKNTLSGSWKLNKKGKAMIFMKENGERN